MSDVEERCGRKAPSKTLRAKAHLKNKGVMEVASDEHSGSDNEQVPATKRRAIVNRSYVRLERHTSAKAKDKEKVFVLSLSLKNSKF